jgi:hypothetical protein
VVRSKLSSKRRDQNYQYKKIVVQRAFSVIPNKYLQISIDAVDAEEPDAVEPGALERDSMEHDTGEPDARTEV